MTIKTIDLADMVPTDLHHASDHNLMAQLEALRTMRQGIARDEFAIEQLLIARMQGQGASDLPDDTYTCKLKERGTYNQHALTPLLELLPDAEVGRCYRPPWTETVEHPGRWELAKLRPLAMRLGGRIKEIVMGARIPGDPFVEVRRRDDA